MYPKGYPKYDYETGKVIFGPKKENISVPKNERPKTYMSKSSPTPKKESAPKKSKPKNEVIYVGSYADVQAREAKLKKENPNDIIKEHIIKQEKDSEAYITKPEPYYPELKLELTPKKELSIVDYLPKKKALGEILAENFQSMPK